MEDHLNGNSTPFQPAAPLLALALLAGVAPLAAAAPVAGQGSWQATLQPRDLDGNGQVDAFYDTLHDLTWLRHANAAAAMNLGVAAIGADGLATWAAAQAWIVALNAGQHLGRSDWRLPTLAPVDGVALNTDFSADGSTDLGFAAPGQGWRNAAGVPTSELGSMYTLHLGNLPICGGCTGGAPDDAGGGLINTAGFDGLEGIAYWTDRSGTTPWGSPGWWQMQMTSGYQFMASEVGDAPVRARLWAVFSGGGDLGTPDPNNPPGTVSEPGAAALLVLPLAWLLGRRRGRSVPRAPV